MYRGMEDIYGDCPKCCCLLKPKHLPGRPHPPMPCRDSPVWQVHHKNVGTSWYCEQHVPPLGTPRQGGYRHRGTIRDYDESKDPKPGDVVSATIGGVKSYGVVVGFTTSRFRDRRTDEYTIEGIRVKWRGWKELSLPVHYVKHADPLMALAFCAEEEKPYKKRHHKR